MKTQAIVFADKCQPELREIDIPAMRANEIRVRNLCSGISIGTERLLWEGKLRYASFPMVIGYQAASVVEEVGDKVTDLKPGDRVVIRRTRLEGEVAAVSGAHCAGGVVERAQVTPVSADLDPVSGSMFVLPCVGYWGVDMAGVQLDDFVVVQGAGQVGLAVVAACKLRGARVAVVDVKQRQLEIAGRLGADWTIDAGQTDPVAAVREIAAEGADVVFESTGFGHLIDTALAMTRRFGKFVFQGNYGDAEPVRFTYHVPHGNQLTCFFPCNDGLQPCRREVTRLMARRAIDWTQVITHVFPGDQGPDAYRMIMEGREDPVGVVIQWSEE